MIILVLIFTGFGGHSQTLSIWWGHHVSEKDVNIIITVFDLSHYLEWLEELMGD